MTPVGHAAVSVLLARWRNWPMTAAVVGGLAPDVDFALLPFRGFNDLHRVITHNIFFVLIVAAACAAFAPGARVLAAKAAGCCGLAHLAIDSALDSNASNGVGVALFWPITSHVYSPVNLASVDCHFGWDHPWRMAMCALPLLLWELPLWMAAAAVLVRRQRAKA